MRREASGNPRVSRFCLGIGPHLVGSCLGLGLS
ncbi:hypothetical protein F383_37815 [Gossypium arboreum]|uniref:Uncharacterized protein n=1 Tax=Gossypium arboreum TaxID=29729 RepID=A0A0B0M961_GOSAR|nr:hypothetical protein F383_37815 [Gossypium arboreum]